MHASFVSTTFVRNNLHSHIYLRSYVGDVWHCTSQSRHHCYVVTSDTTCFAVPVPSPL